MTALYVAAAVLASAAVTAAVAWRIHLHWTETHRYDCQWTPADRQQLQAELAVSVSARGDYRRRLAHTEQVNRQLTAIAAGLRPRRPIPLGPPARRTPIPDYGSHRSTP